METRAHEVHPKDRIYKTITLRASRGRAWGAISDVHEFGAWFGIHFDPEYFGPFVEGVRLTGTITPTIADRDVANEQRAYAGMPIELFVDRIEPDRLIAFRWHPLAIERTVDYAAEPTTLVSLELEDDPEGVVLTITESGFDRLPPARRKRAFAANERGWELQTLLVRKYLERS